MRRLELESLYADRAAVSSILQDLGDSDPIGAISFGSRLSEIEAEIERLSQVRDTIGSVALMFTGEPVSGSRSIVAEFASSVIRVFQDLVTKRIATEEFGKLGARGRVPGRTCSVLALSELVRGSVGFVLEESATNAELVETPIKVAIDDVTAVINQAAAESDADFEASMETLDARVLVSLREFFQTLDNSGASVRIVADKLDTSLNSEAISRGRLRVETTEVNDTESESVIGELLGLLPDSRRFEMKIQNTGEVVKGSVGASFANQWLELIEAPGERFVGEVWRTKMRIREIRERNRPPRNLYTLLGLVERHGSVE